MLIHLRSQVLRNQYEKEQAQKHVTTQTKFNYGKLARFRRISKNIRLLSSPYLAYVFYRSLNASLGNGKVTKEGAADGRYQASSRLVI